MKKLCSISALALAVACSPAPSQPQPAQRAVSDPQEAMYQRIVRAKVFSETCVDMMSFLEMSIIQEMQFGLWDSFREKDGPDAATARTNLIRENIADHPGAALCSADNPAYSDWRIDVLPEFYNSLIVLMSDAGWNERPLWVRRSGEHMLNLFHSQYGFDASAENTTDIPERKVPFESPAQTFDFLEKFLERLWFQMKLEEKGYRLYPRQVVTPGEKGWAWNGIRSLETGNNYSGFFGPQLSKLKIHWRLLHVRGSTQVSVLEGTGFDGRIRLIGVKNDPDSMLEMPGRAVLLVQDKPDALARLKPDWRAGTLHFEADVQTEDECPGDFCLTFPAEATEAILFRQNDKTNPGYAYEIYAGSHLVFPVPETIAEDEDQDFYYGYVYLPGLDQKD